MVTLNNKSPYAVVGLLLALTQTPLLADTKADTTQATPAVNNNGDNSGHNQRDKTTAEPTAQDQSAAKTDVERTRTIRRAIMDDKSLSTYAQNIKIITDGGDVVLKGPVRSEREKAALERIASQYVGNKHVRSEIEITPP